MKHQRLLETEEMLKNERFQCVICCSNWKYTKAALITVQMNINKGVLITIHKN